MIQKPSRNELRKKRHLRVRKKVFGTPERPRLNVFRSNKHIYAQIIDDLKGHTLVAASTLDKELRDQIENGGNVEAAAKVGALVAKRALEKGITKVVFDRGGYKYHGRVKALAEAAREAGLEF
ncbi:MAG TPA: 50S ribosomal protein L18 [Calditerricola sp.]|uniref:Large ribosomal subunit protein uL18 n=1 Tax=Calditerricola satsumensis TaxID=373054 RepID=A0A8J3B7S2_9BACI|nr:50S ribosomal protein L18 [Calditerricola satsumensis]GGK01794.1 50S ribosomal protein L18 [Calditerricola satsumensis]